MLVATLVGMRDSKNNLQQWLVLKHDQHVGCHSGWHERCPEHVGNMLSIRKNRSVQEALQGDRWVLDLRHANSSDIARQVVQLAREIRSAGLALDAQMPDSIRWS